MTTPKKPILLLILDGWGLRDNGPANAIELANPTRYQQLLAQHPFIGIDASGEAVGLPDGQMGNSEVGHLNIGAGRVVYQELTRISKAIRDGDFFGNSTFLNAIKHCKKHDSTLHLMGLVSDGGVHSCMTHLFALLELAKRQGVTKLRVHAFLDGRDVPPKSTLTYLEAVEEKLHELDFPQIATVSGRYYAMDRDNRWERTQKAYDNLTLAEGRRFFLSLDAVRFSYGEDITDEFVLPAVTDMTYEGMQDGDSLLFFNFRPDRARQLTRAFTEPDFDGFERRKVVQDLEYVCMTMYDETFTLPVAYPKIKLDRILSEVLSEHGIRQFRTAETEKYAHVTFFFNGGFEAPYPGEDRKMIPSPKVATYDLQPEMSLATLTDTVVAAVQSKQYDFIVVNFANPDMVGHTGILPAAIDAVKAVDTAIGRVADAMLATDGVMLLTADHGNIECMQDAQGGPHTAHTTALVPLMMISNDPTLGLDNSATHSLSNIAPTILELFGLPQPPEMTSESLLVRNKVAAEA